MLERFNALIGDGVSPEPRYNVAPTQPVAVVQAREGERRLDVLTCGLTPTGPSGPSADTLSDPSKSYFRTALARRRCVIPASGFYELRGCG